MKKYKVSEECIACRACVEVAGDNFEINDNNIAYLIKQPENIAEETKCNEAMDVCPVNAISAYKSEDIELPDAVLASSNIKETLDKYPELRQVLINLSPMFKRMQNPVLYNTLAKFANFNDAAKISGLSVCEILHSINMHLGTEAKLMERMPDCLEGSINDIEFKGVEISWEESSDRYIYNNNTLRIIKDS